MSYKIVTLSEEQETISYDNLHELNHTLVCGKYLLVKLQYGELFVWVRLAPTVLAVDGPYESMKEAAVAARLNTDYEIKCFLHPRDAFEYLLETGLV